MLIGNPAIRVWILGLSSPPQLRAPTPRFPPPSLLSSAFPSGAATPATQSGHVSPVSPSTPASSIPDDEFSKPNFDPLYSPTLTPYSAPKALALTNTSPLPLASKEHLGILNGTAFSAGVAALTVNGAKDVAVLGAVSPITTRVNISPSPFYSS